MLFGDYIKKLRQENNQIKQELIKANHDTTMGEEALNIVGVETEDEDGENDD